MTRSGKTSSSELLGMNRKKQWYAWAGPYTGWLLQQHLDLVYRDLYRDKVRNAQDLLNKIHEAQRAPDLMAMHNFIVDRQPVIKLCRELGVNTIHGEDGFFPHYGSFHLDPLGFCWESSLPAMDFRKFEDRHRPFVQKHQAEWVRDSNVGLPPGVKKPFVLWPLQLYRDNVNKAGLNTSDWTPYLSHFRALLPAEYQLVLKPHPRALEYDANMLQFCSMGENTLMIPKNTNLKALLKECNGVAGVNSTVLYEARLMFHKPAYVYGNSWFTNHDELFMSLQIGNPIQALPGLSWLDDARLMNTERLNDYADWFLYQLLARQIPRHVTRRDREDFLYEINRLSYHSFVSYGEEIFDLHAQGHPLKKRPVRRLLRPGIIASRLSSNG